MPSRYIGLTEKVDFILAFYMIHEVPDQDKLFENCISILKPGGKIFIIEPMFHVSKKAFEEMIGRLKNIGFEIIESPKVFFSRTVLLNIRNDAHERTTYIASLPRRWLVVDGAACTYPPSPLQMERGWNPPAGG